MILCLMDTSRSQKIAAKVQADGIISSAIKRIVLRVLSVKSNLKSLKIEERMAQARMVGQWLRARTMVI